MCEQRRPVTSRNYKREQKANATGEMKGGGGKDTGHWDNGDSGTKSNCAFCQWELNWQSPVELTQLNSTQLQMSNRSPERESEQESDRISFLAGLQEGVEGRGRKVR